ncbi:hypothetical protein [Sorangium sp. So ce406]|uniref:hypothetical protein n=1 Tax=Sorangium sp. So ce406 TaxID=3133311 RepID=UPI003F5B7999
MQAQLRLRYALLLAAAGCQPEARAEVTAAHAPASAELTAASPGPRPAAAPGPPVSPAAAAPGPARRASATGAAGVCERLCATSQALGCLHADQCLAACAAMQAQAPCSAEMQVALACFARQPASAWACGEDGVPSVKEGICDAEQEAYVRCVERS